MDTIMIRRFKNKTKNHINHNGLQLKSKANEMHCILAVLVRIFVWLVGIVLHHTHIALCLHDSSDDDGNIPACTLYLQPGKPQSTTTKTTTSSNWHPIRSHANKTASVEACGMKIERPPKRPPHNQQKLKTKTGATLLTPIHVQCSVREMPHTGD